jgi:hypothetical protein
MCGCGRPEGEHGLILYAGGPGALFPEATGEAAERGRRLTPAVEAEYLPDKPSVVPATRIEAAESARKRTPAVKDAPGPVKPPTALSGGKNVARRRSAKEAALAKAWRAKAAEQKGKRA